MTFDDYMRSRYAGHKPTDDSTVTRMLRDCWNAAVAAAAIRSASATPPTADAPTPAAPE